MESCIFCKIISGEIPSVKIWEDYNYLAFLDINPNTEGMTILIPKKHFNSYIFDLKDIDYSEILLAAKKVGKILDKKLNVKRTALVIEGLGINHLHVKLYPLHGLKDLFEEVVSKDIVYFEKYPGYITTQLGPKKSFEELNKIAEKIKKQI
ncbi:MAG: HIT family protein [Candidatus Micrarchaeaceae archaeon]